MATREIPLVPFLTALSAVCLGAASRAQTTWTGAVSTNWHVGGNWDSGLVPDSSTDVVIAPAVHQPSSYLANPVCDELTIEAGASMSLTGGFDLEISGGLSIAGSLSVTSSSSDIDVAGDWRNDGAFFTSSGAAVRFVGTGAITGTSSTAFGLVVVAAGQRTLLTDATAVELTMTGGETLVGDDHLLRLSGDLVLLGGILSFQSLTPGFETIDVDGDATVTAVAGAFGGTSRILCAGDWFSTAAFAPVVGTVVLDGASASTVSGIGVTFPDLQVASGVKTVLSPILVAGDLTVSSGAALDADAAFDVNGSVVLGDPSASFDVGALTHTVAGDWRSSGGSAIGSGVLHFDGSGTVVTSSGVLPDVTSVAGIRALEQATISGDLQVLAGTVSAEDVVVTGDVLAMGGNLGVVPGGTLDVGGNLDALASVLVAERSELDVSGLLAVSAGGALSVVGRPGQPATVTGAVDVRGALAARHFVFRRMGASGVAIGLTATIAPAPQDLRMGRFEEPSPVPGSALLHIERPSPALFEHIAFQDPLGVGTYNVRALAGSAITFQNWSGGFGGPAFEDDPFGLIDWGAGCPKAIAASESIRSSPGNPDALLPGQTSLPVLGATWDPKVDTSLIPGTVLVEQLFATFGGAGSAFSFPNPMGSGSLLCDLFAGTLFGPFAPTAGPGTAYAITVPSNCALAGLALCAQSYAATSLAPSSLVLTNALDITIGTY